MLDADLESAPLEPAPRARPLWLLEVLARPRRVLTRIFALERPAWFLPLLALSLLAVAHTLVAGPLREIAAQNSMAELPPEFQYYSEEQQAQLMAARAASTGPMFTRLFPALGLLGTLWIGWILLGSLLHLTLTLGGSRHTNTAALNLAAWSTVPIGLRLLVQIVAMLAGGQLIAGAGLSGFVAGEGGAAAFLRSALTLVDGFFLWQTALLLLGARMISGLPRGKAWGLTLLVALILLALMALPGFVGASFGGVQGARPFFFF